MKRYIAILLVSLLSSFASLSAAEVAKLQKLIIGYAAEERDPRAKNFDPRSVVDSSFIQELDKSGFIDSVWRK